MSRAPIWIKNGFRCPMWIAFKEHGRWGAPRCLSVSPHTLVRYRRVVQAAFEAWKAKNPQPQDRLGFVPRTFTVWALEQAKCGPLKRISDDDIVLDFALYQSIRVYAGTYESGPIGNGARLPALFTDGIHD